MIPPSGFRAELYPLRHRLKYGVGLSMETATKNSAFFTLIRHTSDVAKPPEEIEVNPHNTAYTEDGGACCHKMSIINKLSLALKFSATELWNDSAHTSGLAGAEVFSGDGIHHIHVIWRPVFFSFKEKLEAADDDTTTTVEAILALTKDATFEDVVPLTTTKLQTGGISDLSQPLSSAYIVELGPDDYNMTTDATMEEHVWDEDLFQNALRRYTNKGALRACVGATRHVHLTRNQPFKNYFIDKFVPRAVRRIMPYSFMGIQIHVPLASSISQDYYNTALTSNAVHVGVKAICNYHEWNSEHYQKMAGTGP